MFGGAEVVVVTIAEIEAGGNVTDAERQTFANDCQRRHAYGAIA